MSNLLPQEMKVRMRREYRLRLLAVGAFVFAAVLGALALLLTPSFVLVSSKLSLSEATLASRDVSTSESYAKTVAEITKANDIAQRLSQAEPDVSITEAVGEILDTAGDDITVQGIVLSRNDASQYVIELRGVAATRDALSRFIDRLKNNPIVTSASVPLTNLAQATEADFTASVLVTTSVAP